MSLSGMNRLFDQLRGRQALSLQPPSTGLYHYDLRSPGERARIHLRIDPDNTGLIWVNASRVMHLNPTAALMAYFYLQGCSSSEVVRFMRDSYAVSRQIAESDYAQFVSQFQELIRPDGLCPIHELDVQVTLPFTARPSAPHRMDLALSYRCNNDCAHCYNDRPRDYPELSTDQWRRILDRLWEIGIPHVVFTGGEPTLRSDLPELIQHAENNGQITGLNTNGRRLSNPDFVTQLVEAGLDHVQITYKSHIPSVHDFIVRNHGAWKQTIAGIRNALDSPLFVMTNTTLLQDNYKTLQGTLDSLSALGVPTIGLNALIYSGKGQSVGTGLDEAELPALLELARTHTENHGQKLIWYTPTQYCHFDPMQLELGVKGCTAALYNMCVEPDGAVLPCQSYYQSLGNLLRDPWDAIWNHQTAIYLRERKYIEEKCQGCALLVECGGGCPLKPVTSKN